MIKRISMRVHKNVIPSDFCRTCLPCLRMQGRQGQKRRRNLNWTGHWQSGIIGLRKLTQNYMATVYKCNQCGKIMERGENFCVTIDDGPGLISDKKRFFISLDLCAECGIVLAGHLRKYLA